MHFKEHGVKSDNRCDCKFDFSKGRKAYFLIRIVFFFFISNIH